MSAPIPDEVRGQLGTGTIQGTDAQGQKGLVPDDLGTGQKTFETNFNNARGDLATVEKNGTTLVNSLNALGDPHASLNTKLAATAALVTLVTTTVVTLATAAQLAAFAAVVGISVPALGAFVIAAFAVMIVVVAAVGEARASAPRQDTDAEALALAINQLPTNLPLPYNVTEPNLGSVRVMGVLARILTAESQAKPAEAYHLVLAQLLGGQAGAADDIYAIAADVLLNPRWRIGLGKLSDWNFASEEQIRQAVAQNPRAGFGLASYEEVLESFRNKTQALPINPGRFQPIQNTPVSPEIGLSIATALDLASLPVLRQVRNQRWIVPRYFPLESPSYDPYDVARYVVIFSVLYSFSDPRQARAATYAAVYLVLLQKAWAYKAAKATVPNELYATMGFMLDLVSQYPFVRYEDVRTFNPVTRAPITVRQPVFKDVDWYIRYYLARAPQYTDIPGTAPDANTDTATPPGKPPFSTVPGTAPGPVRVGADQAVLYPGNYLVEVDNIRNLNPEHIVQILQKYGVSSQILPTPPGAAYRLVMHILSPLRTRGFLAGLRWRLMRKL